MHPLLHRLEKFIDWIIAPVLILLLGVISFEFFYADDFPNIQHITELVDWIVISVFAIDLGFKYNRMRVFKKFVRSYWLEIIATLPFFLVFRLLEFAGLSEIFERSQSLVHGANELPKVERETSLIVKEASRSTRIARIFRIFSRSPRFLKAVSFYEKPHHVKSSSSKRI